MVGDLNHAIDAAIRASASRTASQKRRIAAASFTPRDDSTPEETSTAQGRSCRMPANDVCGMQPTRQNERKPVFFGKACRNERPIECLSTAAETLDMGIEQEALRLSETAREV